MRYEIPDDHVLRFEHILYLPDEFDAPYTPRTIARLVDPTPFGPDVQGQTEQAISYGIAWCRRGEHWTRRIGREIAAGRAARAYAEYRTTGCYPYRPYQAGWGDVPSWVLTSRDISSVRSFDRLGRTAR